MLHLQAMLQVRWSKPHYLQSRHQYLVLQLRSRYTSGTPGAPSQAHSASFQQRRGLESAHSAAPPQKHTLQRPVRALHLTVTSAVCTPGQPPARAAVLLNPPLRISSPSGRALAMPHSPPAAAAAAGAEGPGGASTIPTRRATGRGQSESSDEEGEEELRERGGRGRKKGKGGSPSKGDDSKVRGKAGKGKIPDPKNCTVCGREITWRKKWERCWDDVKYCSDKCRGSKGTLNKGYEERILEILQGRDAGKTMCPSEVLPQEQKQDKAIMEEVRQAARRLVHRGLIEITQKGQVVDPSAFRGPIRLRLVTK